ncbi:peptidoglycan DD-metalloendopeptidase family protein [Streptomyces sp. NPDC004838]
MLANLKTGLLAGAAVVAAGAGVLFAEAFTQAVEQDKSNARLAASLGLSPKQADQVGKTAGGIYAKGYGQSIDEVNTALRQLAQNGVVSINAPKKEVEGLTKSALNLAETFETDVGASARAAGQLVKTGLAKDSTEAFDLITRGFQTGADKSEDFLDTLNEYGTQFRDLGLTGSQAIGLISQGLAAGARDGDIVADTLKEFAIRAKDGSEDSAEGFKRIGLNASAMAQAFSKGGPAAATALDTVLDRLRGIEDPAKRSQTAVMLFGTQAEDLQQSLFALDPSAATSTLGKVGGAADKMGKTLHSSATNSIEVFKRQFMQGLVNFITAHVLPAVAKFGDFLNRYILPPARTVGGFLGGILVRAVTAVATAFMAGVRWLKEYGAWLLPLGVAIAGVTITVNASAIATAAMTAVFSIYRGVIIAAAAVTRGYAIAQGIVNAVMAASPIGLIITGIAALVTLLVVAYNKSDTFRGIVQATWAGIKTGWDLLWTNALKPGFDGLMIGLRAIGTAASWLWTTVLSPVFSFIWTAAKILVAIVVVAVVTPIVLAFRLLAAVAGWLWTVAIKPAFDGIAAAALWLWTNGIKPAFDLFKLGIQTVGDAGKWLWTNVISPVFGWIAEKAKWLWNNGIKPSFDLLKLGIRTVGDTGKWLWNEVISPVFGWISEKASWLWDKGIKPAFDKIKSGVALVGDAFGLAKDAIGKAWNKVKDIAKGPVNFIIEWVYTKGIKKVWDGVAGFVGLDPLPAAPKLLAAGGTVGNGWGPAAPMKVNRPTAIVGEGNPRHPEFVIPTDPRYRSRALALHAAAGTQLMAKGGILGDAADWLGDTAKKIGGAVMSGVDFLSDPSKMWEKATAFIRDKVKEIGASKFAQMIGKVPGKMLAGLKDKVLSAASGFFGGDSGGGGGGSWGRPVNARLGTRYGVRGRMWSSGYHTGTDFPAAIGTAVRAAAAGVVQSARSGGPYGNHLLLQHGGGLSSLYAHLSSMGVRTGQTVTRGMRIGAVGNTGNTTGPHLHFEARRGGRSINPERLLGYADGGRVRAGQRAIVGENGWEIVQFGRAATVYSHEDSVRMAAGAAAARAAAGSAAAAGVAGVAPPQQAVPVVRLYFEGQELRRLVRVESEGVVEDTLGQLVDVYNAGRG